MFRKEAVIQPEVCPGMDVVRGPGDLYSVTVRLKPVMTQSIRTADKKFSLIKDILPFPSRFN